MKVLICSTEYPPTYSSGIGNVAFNVVEKLREKNISCTVCSPTNGDIHIGSTQAIERFGILGLLYYWYKVSKYFKDNEYDVAWLHNPLFLEKNPFKKSLITVHITTSGQAKQNLYSFPFSTYKKICSIIEKYCVNKLENTQKFTGISPQVITELKDLGISEENIQYIPNGVNTIRFHPPPDKKPIREKIGIAENDIVLLSVGRLTPQKQHSIMIEVFSHLEKELKNVTLCIAGRGELFETTKDLAEGMGLHKVLFLGYVDDRDLPDLYACSDYYIMTSSYEGLPLTLLEAMASGLPCIVSDIPNLGIVKEANCGIIVKFKGIEESAQKIIHYLNSDHRDHSINARKFAENNLDWNIIAEEYLRGFYEVNHEDHVDLI